MIRLNKHYFVSNLFVHQVHIFFKILCLRLKTVKIQNSWADQDPHFFHPHDKSIHDYKHPFKPLLHNNFEIPCFNSILFLEPTTITLGLLQSTTVALGQPMTIILG